MTLDKLVTAIDARAAFLKHRLEIDMEIDRADREIVQLLREAFEGGDEHSSNVLQNLWSRNS